VWIENYKPSDNFDPAAFEEVERVQEEVNISARQRRAAFVSGTMWYQTLVQCQKRPSTVSKETQYSVKRDLVQCQKRPSTVSKET